jgi:hypothetical protein
MRHVLLIARLQWLIFKNSLRSGVARVDLVFRILVSGSLAAVAIAIGTGLAVAFAVHPPAPYDVAIVSFLLAGILVYWQVVPLLLASSGLGVDVGRFRHFPVSDRILFAIDLLVGALDPVALSIYPPLAGLAMGLSIQAPAWAPVIVAGLLAFAAFNVALSRLIVRLLERLLANRRVKEIVLVLVFLVAFVPQIMLMRGNDSRDTPAPRAGSFDERVASAASYLAWTPPGLAAGAAAGHDRGRLLALAGMLAFGAALLALSYRQLHAPARERPSTADRRAPAAARSVASPGPSRATDQESRITSPSWVSPARAAIVRKEIRYVYRSPRTLVVYLGAFLGSAIFAVFLGTLPSAIWRSEYALPGFCLFGLWQVSFLFTNALCFDGHGAKLYFMSPVRGADVLAGKNAVAAMTVALQTVLVTLCFQLFVTAVTPRVLVLTALAVATALLLMLAAGNVLSSLFPHPVSTKKLMGQTASGMQLFASLLMVGVVFSLVAAGPIAGGLLESRVIAPAALAVELACAVALYALSVSRGGRLLERRAERVVEALTKEE